jgi:hypothetical protein
MPEEFFKYTEADIPSMIKYIETITRSQVKRANTIANDLERTELIEARDNVIKKFTEAKKINLSKDLTTSKNGLSVLISLTNQILSQHPNDYRYPTAVQLDPVPAIIGAFNS